MGCQVDTFFEAPFRGVTFGGSGVSIGGVKILRATQIEHSEFKFNRPKIQEQQNKNQTKFNKFWLVLLMAEILHQLRLVVSPILSQVLYMFAYMFYTSQVVIARFLNHQQ